MACNTCPSTFFPKNKFPKLFLKQNAIIETVYHKIFACKDPLVNSIQRRAIADEQDLHRMRKVQRYYSGESMNPDAPSTWRMKQVSARPDGSIFGASSLCGSNPEMVGVMTGAKTTVPFSVAKEWVTPNICYKEWVQAEDPNMEFENYVEAVASEIARQESFLIRNLLYSAAHKYVVAKTGNGQVHAYNTTDPTLYPKIADPNAIGILTRDYLQKVIYPTLTASASAEKCGFQENGAEPVFAVLTDNDVIETAYYKDIANLTSQAVLDANVLFYPDPSKVFKPWAPVRKMGQFALKTLKPGILRRFRLDVAGNLEVIDPFVAVPLQGVGNEGVEWVLTEEYKNARIRESLVLISNPFIQYTWPQVGTLGAGSYFNKNTPNNFVLQFNSGRYLNGQVCNDLFNEFGFYAAKAEMGFIRENMNNWMTILSVVPGMDDAISYLPANTSCPQEENPCVPTIGEQGCPCGPQITCSDVDKTSTNRGFLKFSVPVATLGLANGDLFTTTLANGAPYTFEVYGISLVDPYEMHVAVPNGGVFINEANAYLGYTCESKVVCKTKVRGIEGCAGLLSATQLVAKLTENLVCSAAGSIVNATFGKSGVKKLQVVSANLATQEWKFTWAPGYGPTDGIVTVGGIDVSMYEICCREGGLIELCCEPTPENGCVCEDPAPEYCQDEQPQPKQDKGKSKVNVPVTDSVAK